MRHSEAAEAFMLIAGDPLAVSSWSEVELFSATGVRLRTKQLTEVAVDEVVDTYSRLFSPQLHRISVEKADHRQVVVVMIQFSGRKETARLAR